MKTLHVPPPVADRGSRFEAARMLASSLAESDSQLIEPEMVAWVDRSSTMESPVLEGCGGPDAWRDYGASHGGRLEVDVGDETSFIFAESSQFDSYDHFAPGPFRNLRDAQGNEFVCDSGGRACVPLDDWTSRQT